MLLLNAFSLNMLPPGEAHVTVSDITVNDVLERAHQFGLESGVGHADTAALFQTVLGIPVPVNRISVAIPGPRQWGMSPWTAIVGQYSGPRLPEGATELPPGATIRWMAIYVE